MQKSLTARINNILSYILQLLHNEEHIKLYNYDKKDMMSYYLMTTNRLLCTVKSVLFVNETPVNHLSYWKPFLCRLKVSFYL